MKYTSNYRVLMIGISFFRNIINIPSLGMPLTFVVFIFLRDPILSSCKRGLMCYEKTL